MSSPGIGSDYVVISRTMPTENSSNKRRSRPDDSEATSDSTEAELRAGKRRAFLQTMGHQLREFGSERNSSREDRRSFAASANGRYYVPSLSGALAAERAQSQIPPESDVVPGEEDQSPTGATKSASEYLWRSSEVLTIPASNGSHAFSFDDLLDWTRYYFDNWHPAYPFLHAPTILSYFEDAARSGVSDSDNTRAYQLIILRSILSISVADRRQMGTAMRPVPASLVFHSFNDAISSIQRVLTDETSIPSLQAVVSVQLFLLSMLRYNAASRLEGLAVRMVFQLGLHRCPIQFSAFSRKEAELRKRLFWTIYCIDRYICLRLGIPLAIRDDDINVCRPSSERHVESDPLGR